MQPVPERFCLEIRAIKRYEWGCKPRPARTQSRNVFKILTKAFQAALHESNKVYNLFIAQ